MGRRESRRTELVLAVLALLVLGILIACTQPTGSVVDPPAATDGEPDTDDPAGDPADDPADDPDGGPTPDPERHYLSVDFDGATEGYAAEGFRAMGFAAEPAAGYLDSDAWQIVGLSDGDLEFGQEADGGDYARGASTGGVSTGGLYAFEVEEGNFAMGFQATATDFAPGSVTMRVPVGFDAPTDLDATYALWVRNDQDRSSRWVAMVSLDGEQWTEFEESAIVTTTAADPAATWVRFDVSLWIDLAPLRLDVADTIYLRWESTDVEGTGGRDEVAIDDITVTLTGELTGE
jgi:hypothetical protein